MDRFDREPRLSRDDAEKSGGGSGGTAAVLLPVLERFDAHADQAGELGLGEFGALANFADAGGSDGEPPGWLFLAAQDGAGFTDAADQFVKHILLHSRIPLTRASALALRSNGYADFANPGSAFDEGTELRVGGKPGLKHPILLVVEQRGDLPRECRSFYQFQLSSLSAIGG